MKITNFKTTLVDVPLELVEGMITVPERPGTGFSFDKDAIKGFSV